MGKVVELANNAQQLAKRLARTRAKITALESRIRSSESELFLMYRADEMTVEEARAKARVSLRKEYDTLAQLKGEAMMQEAELNGIMLKLAVNGVNVGGNMSF